MLIQGHIFNPKSDSLESRIEAFKLARKTSTAIKVSSEYMDNPDWQNRLGETQELEEAKQIIENSLSVAANSISQDELLQAQAKGLLNEEEVQELAKIKRKELLIEMREAKGKQAELVKSLKQ